MDFEKFEASDKQKRAFDDVVKAIKKAKNLGLHFYGKQESLVAYNEHAEQYQYKHGFDKLLRASGGQIPCLKAMLLDDSGADDYISFLNEDSKFI